MQKLRSEQLPFTAGAEMNAEGRAMEVAAGAGDGTVSRPCTLWLEYMGCVTALVRRRLVAHAHH